MGTGIMDACRIHVKFCNALHFLGERLTGKTFAPSKAKFGTCCSNSQHSPHFLLSHNFPNCGRGFETETGMSRPPRASGKWIGCGYEVPKILPHSSNPLPLLTELLTSKSAEARHFRSKIRNYNSAIAMESIQADLLRAEKGSLNSILPLQFIDACIMQ